MLFMHMRTASAHNYTQPNNNPGVNYFQSVTPTLSLGGEAFWWASQMKSGFGLAARHANDTSISTLQVASTGLLAATYVHKINDKVVMGT